MSEHTPGENNPTTDVVTDETKPTPDGEKPKLSQTELDAIRARDAEKQKRRNLEKELEALRAQVDKHTRTDAEKRGDVEALRAAMAKDIEAERAKAEAAEKRWKTSQKRSAFMTIAHQLFADTAIEDAYALLESKLDVTDDDGEPVVQVIDSALSLQDYLKQFAEKKPHLAKNKGANGTGAQGSPGDDKSGGYSAADLEKMSPGEYRALVMKRPELAKKFFNR